MAPSLRTLLIGLLGVLSTPYHGAHAQEDDDSAAFNSDGDIGHSSFLVTNLQRANNASFLWGPYRPQVYFGVKPRLPESFIGGLMWSGVSDYNALQKQFRHTCEQYDELEGYGWEEYDARVGGRQVVRDRGNKIDLEMEWRKVDGGENGGHWGVRIKGTPRDDAPEDLKTSLWFYAGLEGEGSIELENEEDDMGIEGDVTLKGTAPGLGDFKLTFTTGPETNKHPEQEHAVSLLRPLDRTLYKSFQIQPESAWKAKDVLFTAIQTYLSDLSKKYTKEAYPPAWDAFTLTPEYGPGNLHMVQKVFVGAFEFDVLFSSGSAERPMTSDLLSDKISVFQNDFESRFDKVFDFQEPFNTPEYRQFGRNMFSNLLGGIGYFHGDYWVDKSYASAYSEDTENFWESASEALTRADAQLEGPASLFTSIPSRPFFPRGFYWDEGFHLIPILEWDVDLTIEIVKSWFSLMDEDGWIAREQILGEEARSKVPSEFQIQYPHYANPPTLYMLLLDYVLKVEKLEKDAEVAMEQMHPDQQVLGSTGGSSNPTTPASHLSPPIAKHFLRSIYPSLRKHYEWFRDTQSGDLRTWSRNAISKKEGYRWRGRTPDHCLTSGLDDYPRAQPPHPGELHVDLASWMSVMTRTMRRIALYIGDQDYYHVSTIIASDSALVKNIISLHWSEAEQTFCDVTVDSDDEESVHVCHKGYVSIFPFLVGNVVSPDSEYLKPILDTIRSPDHLWTPYGLRSLSKSDAAFGTGENYWRGPIWININYLALRRLLEYAKVPGPCQKQAREMYLELRKNVVENVFRVWKETGFAWEQYNDETGKGQRTKHFLGWTSLVVQIMKMPGKVSLVQLEQFNWAT